MMNTPWGNAQTVEAIADGIQCVTTAGHGGFKLSDEKHAEIRQRFPTFTTFAGGQWYEEDCDVAVVVYAFSQHFSSEFVQRATETIRNMKDYFKIEL